MILTLIHCHLTFKIITNNVYTFNFIKISLICQLEKILAKV